MGQNRRTKSTVSYIAPLILEISLENRSLYLKAKRIFVIFISFHREVIRDFKRYRFSKNVSQERGGEGEYTKPDFVNSSLFLSVWFPRFLINVSHLGHPVQCDPNSMVLNLFIHKYSYV